WRRPPARQGPARAGRTRTPSCPGHRRAAGRQGREPSCPKRSTAGGGVTFDIGIKYSVEGADVASRQTTGLASATVNAANATERASTDMADAAEQGATRTVASHRKISEGVQSISQQLDQAKRSVEAFAGVSFASVGISMGFAETIKLAD